MNLLPEWLTSLGLRRAAPAAEPDFADMGTAFGLDASMAPEWSRPASGTGTTSGTTPIRLPGAAHGRPG